MDREEAVAMLANAGRATEAAFPLMEAAIACAVHEDPTRDVEATREMAARGVLFLSDRLKRETPAEAIIPIRCAPRKRRSKLALTESPRICVRIAGIFATRTCNG